MIHSSYSCMTSPTFLRFWSPSTHCPHMILTHNLEFKQPPSMGREFYKFKTGFTESHAGRQCKGRQPRNFDFLQLTLNAHSSFWGQPYSPTMRTSYMDAPFLPAPLQTRGFLLHFLWGVLRCWCCFCCAADCCFKRGPHTTQPTVKIEQI